ncbi:Os12g0559150 [Oryza sativa Japonica Group]|uniref:Os12g0559150 protein n=5 Tax=Oryza TaxID=4527 RepID=A0A0P0YBP8_ORYSJ|nr:Os12g0559150 [Oryza sativa Japonica Group]
MSAITSWSAASDAEVTAAPASSERTALRKGRSTAEGSAAAGVAAAAAGEKMRRRSLEGGDEWVVRRGVVGCGARVAEAARPARRWPQWISRKRGRHPSRRRRPS